MQKLNANNGLPLSGAVYQLTRNSDFTEEATTTAAGEITFANLTPGRYQLQEIQAPPGYIPNTTLYYVDIHGDGSVAVDGETVEVFTIHNYPMLAIVVTGDAVNITASSTVILNNTYSGIAGNITAVGVQYSTSPSMASPSVVQGVIASPFSANLTGLQPNTTYYYRAVVYSSIGQFFGQIKSFTTPQLT